MPDLQKNVQLNPSLIQDWLINPSNLSFINTINVDDITYNTADCYTSSFVSVPFFILDLGQENEPILCRYTTIALETDGATIEKLVQVRFRSFNLLLILL